MKSFVKRSRAGKEIYGLAQDVYVDEPFQTRVFIDDCGTICFQKSIPFWRYHREGDKPSLIYPDGQLDFLIDGRYRQEEGKPARISASGKHSYYAHGVWYNEK